MKKRFLSDISEVDGKEATFDGWVYNTRSIGKIWFLILRDGTGMTQCVVSSDETSEEVFNLENILTQESSITVTGIVKEEPRSIGGYEILVKNIVVHQLSQDYPISLKEHGTSFLMDHRHLWIRSKRQHAILKIRHQVIKSCRDFLDNNGFTLVDTPIFTANACEGTSNLFNVDYFDRSAYLTQSGQLYSEASAASFGKVYCFGPTFRAEKSKTRRHLTEFWMVEPEMAYYDLDDNMDLAEQFVESIVQSCLNNCKNELDTLERDTSSLEKVKAPFPRITYDEAVKILSDNGADFSYGNDFGGTDETIISEQYDRPIMVHRWPVDVKAFYMKRDNKNEKLALGVDMLAPEGYGEIIGGGQREDDLEILEKRIEEHGLDNKDFKWYLDLRKYGSVPHSGFGLGIERTVAWITGIKHIRETIPFPRTMSRLEP
ncbi:MAG: asparagine--tRNA ligase [Candidatus Marinimicrobia bacterium]|jgi:asparaginyl-tRNA synthetase|nr:asparagine--tRNA ligase [Candidatus Neomarinimicrobiota bacterium]|tara:strand:+ start:31694 stop:32986 length:1293 start_codon:yes stop_codon:yes gene_type:complete